MAESSSRDSWRMESSEPPKSSEMAELSNSSLENLQAPMSESWCKMVELAEQLRAALREWREEIEAEAEAPTKEPSQEIDSNTIIADDSGEQEISDERSESSPSNLDEVITETPTLQSEVNLAIKDSEEPSIEVLDELAIDDFWILWSVNDDLASKELGEPIDFVVDSVSFLEIPSAHQLFVEMPSRGFELLTAVVDGERAMGHHMEFIAISWPYDRGKPKLVMSEDRVINVYVDQEVALFQDPECVVQEIESRKVILGTISDSVLFDRGRAGIGVLCVQLGSDVCYHCFESMMIVGQSIRILDFVDRKLVFDLGSANFCSELSMSKSLLSTRPICFWMVTVNSYIRVASEMIIEFDSGSFLLVASEKK